MGKINIMLQNERIMWPELPATFSLNSFTTQILLKNHRKIRNPEEFIVPKTKLITKNDAR